MRSIAILIGILWGIPLALCATEPLAINLWPKEAPGEPAGAGGERVLPMLATKSVVRLTDVTQPTLTLYQPAAHLSTGAAVIILPGGAYNLLAMDLEGTEVAAWLNSIGVTALVLKYRVPRRAEREKHDAPLQDAQRGLSLTRAHAAEWGLNPERIGLLGFSAGGHLAAVASTQFNRRSYAPIDEADELSCRPDFAILVYPAYLQKKQSLVPEVRVTTNTPPMFLVHANDDRISALGSALLYQTLKQRQVSAELHIYQGGGHGFGLRSSAYPITMWPILCEAWLRAGMWMERAP